jgi:hypothetical protein
MGVAGRSGCACGMWKRTGTGGEWESGRVGEWESGRVGYGAMILDLCLLPPDLLQIKSAKDFSILRHWRMPSQRNKRVTVRDVTRVCKCRGGFAAEDAPAEAVDYTDDWVEGAEEFPFLLDERAGEADG